MVSVAQWTEQLAALEGYGKRGKLGQNADPKLVLRELALPELEKARQAKQIGKSLEAKLTVNGSGPLLLDAKLNLDSLRELLNVSQVQLPEEGGDTVFATVSKADGQKCERCWHWEADVGARAEHATLCGRCVAAITST